MNPRKKELSLKHDRRNTYGENDKSSRKAIRRRKQWVNQTYRRAIKQSLTSPDPEVAEDRVRNVRRIGWKKRPDRALGDMMRDALIREVYEMISEQPTNGLLFLCLRDTLLNQGWSKVAVQVLIRRLKHIKHEPWSFDLGLDLPSTRGLVAIMRELKPGPINAP